MKKIILVLFGLGLFYAAESGAQNPFIDGMEDIPAPAQTVQIPSANMTFGNEETRFVEAYLKTNRLQFANIKEFYLETLPQLGWGFEGQENNSLRFQRGDEELTVAAEAFKPLIVRLTLTGRP